MRSPLQPTQIKEFIFGGKSIFTLLNTTTKNRYTYQLTRKKSLKEGEEDVIFVKVLSNPDNTKDYTFIGTIFNQKEFKHSPKSPFGAGCNSSLVMGWFIKNLKFLPSNVEVWHEGKCGRCGKRLTDPESIKSGFGAVCRGM